MQFRKFVPITAILLALALLSGCAKKPRRPNPIDTLLGPGGGSIASDSVNPTGFDTGFVDPSEAIPSRINTGDPVANAERGVLPVVYFDFNSASIKPAERAKLAQAADFLKSNSSSKLVLEGHCDWRGTAEYNLALGDRRSKSVQRYLETLGISSSRLITLSKGDLNATKGADSQQMSRERKVEVLVIRR